MKQIGEKQDPEDVRDCCQCFWVKVVCRHRKKGTFPERVECPWCGSIGVITTSDALEFSAGVKAPLGEGETLHSIEWYDEEWVA
jgi:hypothetical protein